MRTSLKPWRRLLTPLRFLVSGGLLAYLVWQADPATILDTWRNASPLLLLLAFMMQVSGQLVSAFKWQGLLQASGQTYPYPWLAGVYFVGQFAGNFLPTTVGGDAVRIVQAGRRGGSYASAGATVFMERLSGFLALSLIAAIALLLASSGLLGARLMTTPWIIGVTGLFSTAALVAVVASFNATRILNLFGFWLPQPAHAPLTKVASTLSGFAPGAVGRAITLSLVFHSFWIGSHLVCGLALGIDAPPLIYALMVPITDIVGLIPIFVNNVGARDLVFTLYLGQVGIPAATAIALAFVAFTIRLCVSAIGGIVLLIGGIKLHATDIRQNSL
jgi:hypothetical protein